MANKFTFTKFSAATDMVVIGYDIEMADISNRDGAIHGFAAKVVATNEFGDTRELFVASSRWEDQVLPKAEKMAAALQARFDNLGKSPVGFDSWATGRAVYGSEAYEAYGREDDLAWERREAEEESWGFR